jgi:hypothetical protein
VGRWRLAFWVVGAWARENGVVVFLFRSRWVEVTGQGIVWSRVSIAVVIVALISMLPDVRNLER